MDKYNKLTIINAFILVVIVIAGIVFFLNSKNHTSKSRIVYIDNVRLFNEFSMTKDIKVIEEKKIKFVKAELDSIFNQYNKVETKTSNIAKQLEFELNEKSKLLKNTQDNYTNNLSQQVWSRLNGYIKDYAQEINVEIVIGTAGNGNIMYAKPKLDITKELIIYCDNKYENKS